MLHYFHRMSLKSTVDFTFEAISIKAATFKGSINTVANEYLIEQFIPGAKEIVQ